MSISRFRMVPSQPNSELFNGKTETTVAPTGITDATAQNLDAYLSLQGASEALLFIEVTAKSSGGGNVVRELYVKFRVSAEESAPGTIDDEDWAWIRCDDLDTSNGESSTRPYTAKILNIGNNFDAGEKTYVLSVPARGSYISARIWSDFPCEIKTKWMRR